MKLVYECGNCGNRVDHADVVTILPGSKGYVELVPHVAVTCACLPYRSEMRRVEVD